MSSYPTNGASLTVKQQRFVEEFTTDFNATQAAIRAGYAENSAGVTGCRLLKDAKISAAVSERLDALSMSADEALMRLTDIARGSLSPFVVIDDTGSVRFDLSSEEARSHLHLLRKIKCKRGTDASGVQVTECVDVELQDSLKALDKILRARGAYANRLEHGGPSSETIPPIQIEIVNQPRGNLDVSAD